MSNAFDITARGHILAMGSPLANGGWKEMVLTSIENTCYADCEPST